MSLTKNPVAFWELATHDQEKSVKFFREVFEWQVEFDERLGFYGVTTAPLQEGVWGGIFTLKKAKLPFVALYIHVEDIEEKAIQIEAHGGFIVEAPKEIPGGSKICLFNEPSGVTFAMIQPAPRPEA